MNELSLLFGLIPLLAFVIIDSFASMKVALISAVVIGLAEAIFSLVKFGSLDAITLFSFFLLAVMAVAAYMKNSQKLFLFQPVVMSLCLGGYILVTYFLGQNLFFDMAVKYREMMPEQIKFALTLPVFQKYLYNFSLCGGIALLCHAAVTAFAALKLNKWWWIAVRGVGFYLFLFIANIVTQKMI